MRGALAGVATLWTQYKVVGDDSALFVVAELQRGEANVGVGLPADCHPALLLPVQKRDKRVVTVLSENS